MPEDSTRLTRRELCEQVWREPLRDVADRYRISDVGLAKLCRRHAIPLPGRGHWQRRAAGKPVKGGPEKLADGDEVLVIEPRRDDDGGRFDYAGTNRSIDHLGPTTWLEMCETAEADWLPLVQKTVSVLRRSSPDERGLLVSKTPGLLPLSVGSGNLERAARIADGFLRACTDLGFIADGPKADPEWRPEIEGVTLKWSLREETVREKQSKTPSGSPPLPGEPDFRWINHPRYTFKPTGRLIFEFKGYGAPVRTKWRDGKRQRVEKLLHRIVEGGIRVASARRQWRDHCEAQRAAEEAERAHREAEQQREEAARERRQALLEDADAFDRAARLRHYIAAIEQRANTSAAPVPIDDNLDRWLTWARSVADSIDPLSTSNE